MHYLRKFQKYSNLKSLFSERFVECNGNSIGALFASISKVFCEATVGALFASISEVYNYKKSIFSEVTVDALFVSISEVFSEITVSPLFASISEVFKSKKSIFREVCGMQWSSEKNHEGKHKYRLRLGTRGIRGNIERRE